MNDLLKEAEWCVSQASREQNDPWISGLPAVVVCIALWVAFFWIIT